MNFACNSNGTESRTREALLREPLHRRQTSGLLPGRRAAKAMIERLIRLGLPRVTPQIVRTLPHDERAFTQGLAYHTGFLYESTGGHGSSSLRRIDPRDGRIAHHIAVQNDFAEGIAVTEGRILQLSWQTGIARVYNVPDLVKIDEIGYDGEGWGLAAGPLGLVMSDGTCILRFCDHRLVVTHTLRASCHGISLRKINDLEWASGRIYANVWFSNEILEISPHSGRVIRVLDCSSLAKVADPGDVESVLNGIAYNPDHGTFYLTGKRWPLLFEVAIPRVH